MTESEGFLTSGVKPKRSSVFLPLAYSSSLIFRTKLNPLSSIRAGVSNSRFVCFSSSGEKHWNRPLLRLPQRAIPLSRKIFFHAFSQRRVPTGSEVFPLFLAVHCRPQGRAVLLACNDSCDRIDFNSSGRASLFPLYPFRRALLQITQEAAYAL